MIEGVRITPLKTFSDERGSVKKMMSCVDPIFKKFGEVYFSVILPGKIKGTDGRASWREQMDRNRRHISCGPFGSPPRRDEGGRNVQKQISHKGGHGQEIQDLLPGRSPHKVPDGGGIKKAQEHGSFRPQR